MDRRLVIAGAVLVLAIVAFLALRPKTLTDEEQIRALVAECVTAAEKHDLATISDAMADDFHGPSSASKQEVRQILLGQLFRNQNGVAVFNPSLDVRVLGDNASFSGVFVFARAKDVNWQEPGDGVTRYDIEGTLEKRSGEWLFTTAEWKH